MVLSGLTKVGRVIAVIPLILRGWVNYFRIEQAVRRFAYVKDRAERKVRRHLMQAKNRQGFGWKSWSKAWLYEFLGFYHDTMPGGNGAARIGRPRGPHPRRPTAVCSLVQITQGISPHPA
jgi:hypothetical protein